MSSYERFLAPCLRLLPPEAAKDIAGWGLRRGFLPAAPAFQNQALRATLWGLSFANPIGLAAGFDKDAAFLAGDLAMGFGFVEAGTVTPRAQPGNPKPRLFRLPEDKAVINRFGFNSAGGDAFRRNLEAYRAAHGRGQGVVGVNVGRNKDTEDAVRDYVYLVRTLSPLADYLCINVSSPNTPGLRDMQRSDALRKLIGACREALDGAVGTAAPPMLVKVSPDLDEAEIDLIAGTALELGVDGVVLTNTTIARGPDLRGAARDEAGGLSGRPIFARSTHVLRAFHERIGGSLPLVGVGGVFTAEDAYAKIRAGASLVQLYTGLYYKGPSVVREIQQGLVELLRRDGHASYLDAVGLDTAAPPSRPVAPDVAAEAPDVAVEAPAAAIA
ncbi:MAG: quinone-dependent dihydroorotate dehydrogenase [Rhodospirillaceae bacterium]|jgi:dihydroorotate dehydrogenase|nr:quinone-dependent dihydroorotate dehydrogenase [Rhodospirillaceae bacterium]MBT6117509.1 quinone-dependent dihydroorotate dehydrogenase [Rhodospirillaceae bacterium]